MSQIPERSVTHTYPNSTHMAHRERLHSCDGLLEEPSTTPFRRNSQSYPHPNRQFPLDYPACSISGGGAPSVQHPVMLKSNRSSRSSDTSSAYSGSDTMHSIQSSLDDPEFPGIGNTESTGDSDEEDDVEPHIECLTVRDTYRECLEKDPNDRTEDDIETLLEFMQHLPAFANMTLGVRRELCAVMVFAVVEKAGTVVMNHGEELDSWSVIVNGMVEVERPDGKIQDLYLGDSFGITPTMEKMHHVGTMRTKMDDCQFVCIAQSEYYRILHQGEENTRKLEENGRVILVTEHRVLDGGARRGHVVIRGTPERLLAQLLDENVLDPGYIEDFLLTHRTFLSSPTEITRQMLDWFQDEKWRDRVTRVVLLWVNNHFTDFETDPDMMEFLEQFEQRLEECKRFAQMRLLNIACATKARTRSLTLARPNREEPLQFQIVGGYETGFDIFIAKVERKSKAEDVGLKRGDQILEVNGQSFTNMSHAKALELFKKSTHLQISVRSNLMGLKEMLTNPNRGKVRSQHRKSLASERSLLSNNNNNNNTNNNNNNFKTSEVYDLMYDKCLDPQNTSNLSDKSEGSTSKKGFMTLGNRTKLKKALAKIMSKNASIDAPSSVHGSDDSLFPGTPNNLKGGGGPMYHSHSNPDLSSTLLYYDSADNNASRTPDFPEHVLKVYRADQTSKFLVVHKETTAREVVMLTLRAFGISDSSSFYSLCEVTVGEGGLVKQRRLPDQMQNLSERMELRSRYYLKNNNSQETLVPDHLAGDLLRDSQVSFLQLNSSEVAMQLTFRDFKIFQQIEPTEYVDDLFEVKNSKYGAPMLEKFADLSNQEMFWVVTQIVSEVQVVRRMRTIKQFIKVARHFREYKNINSMFAILGGLGHQAVSRLKNTWDKLPNKYHKIFKDLQEFMNPSRNMCNYRQLVTRSHPPIIPFYPVARKDLSFIHYGNDTLVDGLVNFEKLRMVSKEVRSLMNMCSQPYVFPSANHASSNQTESSMTVSAVSLGMASHSEGLRSRPSRKKSSTGPNPKKMFEEAQMIRRVKAYISGLKIETDEDKLLEMSNACEPLVGGQSSSLAPLSSSVSRETLSAPPQIRKRHPSPTLSTTSSTSLASSTSEGKKSLGPKFGTDSPQAMRKLLALSEGVTKVRAQSGRTAGPMPTNQSVSPSPSSMRKGSTDVSLPFLVRGGSDSLTKGIHLSPESSSVTSLRRDHASVCSMTSIDSGVGPSSCSSTNSHTDSLGDVQIFGIQDTYQSPYPHGYHTIGHHCNPARFFNNGHRPPPFPHAIAVLPPVPPSLTARKNDHRSGINLNSGNRGRSAKPFAPPLPPPDRLGKPSSSSVSQAVNQSKLPRSRSHEAVNVAPSGGGFFHLNNDEEDTQVSAV